LEFAPHDFRRMFITDAIHPFRGTTPHRPSHRGHTSINTTMGYNAVYPPKTIEAHRAFIARRRALRPAEGNRTPAGTEWEDFLGRFERRKLSESSPHASRLRRSPRVTSRECPRGLRGR
jgi:hypothetical protein